MAPKASNFIIDLVVYPFDVMVSIGEPDEVLFKKLKKAGVGYEDIDGAKYENIGLARYCLFASGQSLIRLKKKPVTPNEYGTLQHEIFHTAASILWRIGAKLKIKTSDECYAYLIGYLTEEIYKRL
jgi:hypothetical protein